MRWLAALLFAAVISGLVPNSTGDALAKRIEVLGLPVPPQAKPAGEHVYVTPLTFRNTVSFYKNRLRKKGIRYQEVPVYRFRGTTIARLISQSPETAWLAVHVFRSKGRTYLALITRLNATQKKGNPTETVDEPAPNSLNPAQ